ncbi:MAG: hypothetical protein MR283_03290 [Erysipelotrichaceae bacterium]|nr:hypothetical protein [Erysipelotrichaceae bacterium]
MATEIGSVELGVKLNDSLEKDAAKAANKADSILTGKFTAIGATIGKVLAIGALVRFGSQCLQLGSDLAEVQNVVDVTFPTMSSRVNEFATNAIEKIGLSQKVAKEYMGQLGSMAQAFGYSEAASYDMAEAITNLTGDVASFYNLSTDEAFTKLKSVFTGETESLKSLGVVMTQTALDEYAMANGFGKITSEMSEQEKVALRLAFVQNALANASGDFARTSDGWANSTRVLTLRFGELKATIGQGLINLFTPLIAVINAVLGRLQTLANYFVAFTKLISGGKGGASGATNAIAENISKASNTVGGLTTGLGNAGKAAGKVAGNLAKAKGFLAGFDDLNILKSNTESGESGGSGGSGGDAGGADFGSMDIPKGSIDTSGVDEIYERIKAVFDKITGFLTKNKVIIVSLLAGIVAGFATFETIKNWSSIVAFIGEMVAPLNTLWIGFTTLFEGIVSGQGVLTSLQAVFGTATGTALFFAGIVAAVTAALVYLYQTGDTFRNLVQTALDSLLSILTNLWTTVLVPLGAFLLDVFNTVIVPIGTFLAQVFVKVVDVIFSLLLSLWNNVLAPIANFLVTVLSIALNTVIDIWNGWKPVIDAIGSVIQLIWDNVLSPLADFIKGAFMAAFEVFGQFIDELIKNATDLFKGFSDFLIGIFTLDVDKAMQGVQEVLRTFLGFLDRVFGTNFSSSFKFINGIVMAFFSGTQQIFDGIKQVFGGLINFIQGVFTGNWKQAWQGIVDIFGGIFSTIGGLVKGPLNAIISIVNGAINRINGVGFTVPDWVPVIGGKGFHVNIPNIPMLANGGYVGANAPRLALIGDNRHEGEIVSPESKIYEQTKRAIDDALTVMQSGNGQEIIIQILYEILETLQNLGIELDMDKLLKLVDQRNKQLKLAKGG